MRVKTPEPGPASVALGVLLDRSQSMEGDRMAAAILHRACAELDVWHAVVAFEGEEWVPASG